MQWKSPVIGTLFFGILVPFTGGCGPSASTVPGPERRFHGAVKVACPGDPPAAVIRDHSRAWAAREDVKVEVVRYDPRAGPREEDRADVWVLPPARLPHWAADRKLLPVPEAYTARESPYAWMSL